VLGFIQGRLGPNRVGPGDSQRWLTCLSSFSRRYRPRQINRFVYFLGAGDARGRADDDRSYPFGPGHSSAVQSAADRNTIPMVVTRFDVALLYVLGVDVGRRLRHLLLAGWSSNNKYSLMGGLRHRPDDFLRTGARAWFDRRDSGNPARSIFSR